MAITQRARELRLRFTHPDYVTWAYAKFDVRLPFIDSRASVTPFAIWTRCPELWP